MISRIPALEFMQGLAGFYADHEKAANLRVWPCGYGVALDLTASSKTVLCGVVGVYGQEIECFVQIGLPNVTRTVGRMVSTNGLRLEAEEPPIEFLFVKEGATLRVFVSFNGEQKASYALQACRSGSPYEVFAPK